MQNRDETIYYLTGRGGKINEGLGQGLLDRGYSLAGREMRGDFDNLKFQDQIDLIIKDLETYGQKGSKIIAVSYGAYLLLHTLADIDPCPSKILLISPVIGSVINEQKMKFYSLPRSDKMAALIKNGDYQKLEDVEIHVGEHDWQSEPDKCMAFAKVVGGSCNVVPDKGHNLGKQYVSSVLDRWL